MLCNATSTGNSCSKGVPQRRWMWHITFNQAASAQAIVTGVEGPKRHLLEQAWLKENDIYLCSRSWLRVHPSHPIPSNPIPAHPIPSCQLISYARMMIYPAFGIEQGSQILKVGRLMVEYFEWSPTNTAMENQRLNTIRSLSSSKRQIEVDFHCHVSSPGILGFISGHCEDRTLAVPSSPLAAHTCAQSAQCFSWGGVGMMRVFLAHADMRVELLAVQAILDSPRMSPRNSTLLFGLYLVLLRWNGLDIPILKWKTKELYVTSGYPQLHSRKAAWNPRWLPLLVWWKRMRPLDLSRLTICRCGFVFALQRFEPHHDFYCFLTVFNVIPPWFKGLFRRL